MLKLLKIAITGGVASGKTTVCQLFQELGAYVVDADTIVQECLSPHTVQGQQILREFGKDILKNGKIDRKAIAEIVFQDRERLRKLEQILHPTVLQEIEKRYSQACKEKKYNLFVVEIPLLFEMSEEKNYDATITVLSRELTAKKRFAEKGYPINEYNRRMSHQLSIDEKSKKANFIINNDGTLDNLKNEVKKIHAMFQTSEFHFP